MTDITVSLEDLETLIFAAAAIKSIEVAMDTRKRDPFVPKDAPVKAALDRLASEARSARRSKETYATPWDGPSEDEQLLLNALCKDHDPVDRDRRMVMVSQGILYGQYGIPLLGQRELPSQSNIHTLAAKGMLVIGTAAKAVIWPGVDQPEFWPDPSRFYLKPTDRGLRKWRELQEAKGKG